MENSVANIIDSDLKQAALASFENFRDSYAWKLEHENKLLAQYKDQYDNQLYKCAEIEKSLNIYKELIRTMGRNPDQRHSPPSPVPDPDPDETPIVNSDASPASSVDYIITTKKKLQYPVSPKAKLSELILSTHYFKSDSELQSMLCFAFNMPNIPMKTVQNSLLELQADGLVKRIKSRKRNEYVTGAIEWFDEFGIPKSEHLNE